MSFEFDGIFQSDSHQKAVYSEMEELVLGVLDGYNVCIMAYGQTGSGKTHSLLGDVGFVLNDDDTEFDDVNVEINNEGIQLQSVKQLFTVSEHRNERYQDVFSFTIVEVHDERLVDLVAGTDMGELQGRVDFDDSASRRSVKSRKRIISEDESSSFFQPSNSSASKGNKTKLEIRTNHDGNTVVQGLVSIPVNNYEDVLKIWREALIQRAARVAENDVELSEHEASSHVIATLKVVSTNIATGIGSVGKINFVDLAGADLTTKRPPIGAKTKPAPPDPVLAGVGNNNEWKYVNKSLATLCEVVNARCQFNRSVPYRNSTLTHLLRDSLEADTKVLLLVCVSSDPKDVQETVSALRFASKMRRVNIGKATKHTLGNSPAS
jgi:kinesin family protein C2/C3